MSPSVPSTPISATGAFAPGEVSSIFPVSETDVGTSSSQDIPKSTGVESTFPKSAESRRAWTREDSFQWIVAALSSTFVHVVVVLVLALLLTARDVTPRPFRISLELDDSPTLTFEDAASPLIAKHDDPYELPAGPPTLMPAELAATITIPLPTIAPPLESSVGSKSTPREASGAKRGTGMIPAGLSGDGRRARRGSARERGASGPSEAAVERGLAWLAAHQRKDGSWRFDHRDGACDGTCENPGNHAATTASTALALLCFYGAAYDHVEGPYADAINKGLYYLGGRMLLTRNGGDMQEGSMYAQGIAAIALCEAAAMTDDPTLRGYGEKAIEYILYAQDQRGGGWRYLPGEPGDTTVTGWQLMALKSAQMSGIAVASPAFEGANRFLDSVQSEQGASYGYRDPQRRDSTSAVGLLGRMYLGWKRDNPALIAGVARLDKNGPSKKDIYFNYYATQVMSHYGGAEWERWNPKMREYLIATQAKTGHAAGSWYFADKHGDEGGRLFSTALAIMTLEVYYRYQPLYQSSAAESGY